jgi:hypothetical protein
MKNIKIAREYFKVNGTLIVNSQSYPNYTFNEFGDKCCKLDNGEYITISKSENQTILLNFGYKFKITSITREGIVI